MRCVEFYGVSSEDVGLFLMPFALGNFLGPLTLGRLFDTLGRRFMITSTYFISGKKYISRGRILPTNQFRSSAHHQWSHVCWRTTQCSNTDYLLVRHFLCGISRYTFEKSPTLANFYLQNVQLRVQHILL